LFAGTSPGDRRMLARLVDEITVAAGEVITGEGEHGYEFVLIEEGEAEVRKGGEPITTLGPGDFFGEIAALNDGQTRSATVAALSDLRGLAFTAHFMREMGERMPALGERIRLAAGERLEADAGRAEGA
jgi:CRP-like cAMP-binding protein